MAFKKRRKTKRGSYLTASLLSDRIGSVERLLEEGYVVEARDALLELLERYPKNVVALRLLGNVAVELEDVRLATRASEPLFELQPDDPDVASAAANARILAGRPALALQAFERLLRLEPEGERAAGARKAVELLEPDTRERAETMGLGADPLGLLAMHERIGVLVEIGTFDEVRRAVDALLAREPRFAPALNNFSLVCERDGKLEEAIGAARRVLAFAPDNPHALSNLARFLVRTGRGEEAAPLAERLRAARVERADADAWIKKLEALAMLGDDEGALAVFGEAERAGALEAEGEPGALLLHYAAVAALRTGREREARDRWAEAVRRAPGLDVARENLADLDEPAGERHAPWPFPFPVYVSRRLLDEMLADVKRHERRRLGGGVEGGMRAFLARHPEVVRLIPVLLDRGDPHGREFALRLASGAATPETLEALREFALGSRGPDEIRLAAAQEAMKAGLLPRGATSMWVRGERQDVQLMGMEIHYDVDAVRSPRVEELMRKGSEALHAGDFERARSCYERVLELDPTVLGAKFNSAVALREEGEVDAFEAAVREIHREHPDYLFARTSLARLEVDRGRLEEAEALLAPLAERSRLHVSEAQALFDARIALDLAHDHPDAAGQWVEMWERLEPDSPAIGHWENLIARHCARRR